MMRLMITTHLKGLKLGLSLSTVLSLKTSKPNETIIIVSRLYDKPWTTYTVMHLFVKHRKTRRWNINRVKPLIRQYFRLATECQILDIRFET